METALVEIGRYASEIDVGAVESIRTERHIPIVRVIVIRADVIAGGREVAHPGRMNFIDGLTDKSVLEKWLVRVAYVVTNDVRAKVRREREDVIGKIDFAAVRSRKTEASLWRHLVTNLDHATSFIRSRKILENNNRLLV